MADTQYGTISQRTALWAAVEMLDHAQPVLVLSRFGLSKPLPKNKADNVKFRRPVPFAAATTPLTEGVAPTAQAMAYEDVAVTIAQYGAVVKITDKVADLCEDPVLKDATELCGEQAGATIEALTYAAIRGGTNVFYANGASRVAVNTKISLPKQRAVTRLLKKNKGKKVTKMVAASVNIATEPVDHAYIAFCHSDCETDIRDLVGFVPIEKYGTTSKALPYEIGKCEDVRYVCSPDLAPFADAGGVAGTTMLTTTGTSADVYPVIYVSENSYGLVPLQGAGSITPTVIDPGKPTKDDPLGQVGYVGWKTWFCALILNQAWLARLEVGATKNA